MITLTAKIEYEQGQFIEITPSNSISIESSINERENTDSPSFGVISNSGNLSFIDTDLKIKKMIDNKTLIDGMRVYILLSNTISGLSCNVGKYFTKDWNYDKNTNKVSVTITDNLEKMQDEQIDGFNFDIISQSTKTAKDIYDYLQGITSNIGFEMQNSENLDENTKSILNNYVIFYPILQKTNLWNAWNKFCLAFLLHIYQDKNGLIVCKYNGGN